MAGRGAHDLVFTAPGGGLRNTRFRSRVFDRAKKETRAIGSAGARPVASIEQHAARSSLMSLLDRARDFNALMPMLRIPATVNFGGCQDYGKHKK